MPQYRGQMPGTGEESTQILIGLYSHIGNAKQPLTNNHFKHNYITTYEYHNLLSGELSQIDIL